MKNDQLKPAESPQWLPDWVRAQYPIARKYCAMLRVDESALRKLVFSYETHKVWGALEKCKDIYQKEYTQFKKNPRPMDNPEGATTYDGLCSAFETIGLFGGEAILTELCSQVVTSLEGAKHTTVFSGQELRRRTDSIQRLSSRLAKELLEFSEAGWSTMQLDSNVINEVQQVIAKALRDAKYDERLVRDSAMMKAAIAATLGVAITS